MRYILGLITIILVLSLSVFLVKETNAAPVDPRCLSFKVTFTAKNWVGGPIQIGCQGDNGDICKGGIKNIKPNGKPVILGNCSCPFNNRGQRKDWADGCLYVAKELKPIKRSDSKNRPGVDVKTPLPQKCTINTNKFELVRSSTPGFYKTKDPGLCGQNKREVEVPIRITCPGPSITVTNTHTPTPTTSCPAPSPVTNVKIKCPECRQSTPTSSPTGIQATATPTTAATATPTTAATATPTTAQGTGGNE
jgi:hypothetical protein